MARHRDDGGEEGTTSAEEEGTTPAAGDAPDGEGRPRRGLRPLAVLALCAVVSVAAVWATQTVDKRWTGYGSPPPPGAVDATGGAATADGAGPSASPPSPVDSASAVPVPTGATTPGTTPGTTPATTPAAAPPAPAPQRTTSRPVPAPPTTTAPVQPVVSYEAESLDNTKTGTTTYACAPCSGGQKVGEVGDGTVLTFNAVTAVTTGNVRLTVAYVNGDATRTATMSVDGGPPVSLNFPPTGGWNSVGTLVVTVALHAGGNTIAFANAKAFAPDFDRVTIGPAIG